MQNPFTTTFSKIPNNSYIPTEKASEIIENFNYDDPSESVYKITGVRGSGKTVLLAKIEEELSSNENKEKGWLVYRLSPNRDMLQQLAAKLQAEDFIHNKKRKLDVNISANIKGIGASIGVSNSGDGIITDYGQQIESMIELAQEQNKKFLISIDEVSKTKEMIEFASEFGNWLRAGYPIYLVCTGLYENIEQLYNVKNLTFFRRATNIKTDPLNMVKMTAMYKAKLNISSDLAKSMAEITKGYAYAFQELGALYFKKDSEEKIEDVLINLKTELFAYSYEKIWKELTDEDRSLVKAIYDKEEYKREEILYKMEKPQNYSVYRDRLIRRGIINARQGYISLALPYFDEYIKEYCICI